MKRRIDRAISELIRMLPGTQFSREAKMQKIIEDTMVMVEKLVKFVNENDLVVPELRLRAGPVEAVLTFRKIEDTQPPRNDP